MSTTRFSQLHPRQSWWIRLFVAVLVMAGLMTIGVGHSAAAPDRQGALHKVYITDVRDNQFVVSWTTDTPSNGQVEWGTTTALGSTTADGVASTTTHYVVITGLAPSTVYYFQVRSGSLVDNNHGSYYTVTTGPTPGGPPGAGKFVYGFVYQQGGMIPVSNTVVYLQLQDADGQPSAGSSQSVTARTDATGGWFYSNLYDIRVANAGAYFAFTDGADRLSLFAQGGSAGTATTVVTVPTTYPTQFANLVLDATPNAVTVSNFTAAAQPIGFGAPLILVAVLGAVGLIGWRLRKRIARA